MPARVRHFAIHADDVGRARRFYEAVFDWRFEPWGPPDFYQVRNAGLMGALQQRHDPLTGTGMRGFEITIGVDDLEASIAKVRAHGGRAVVLMKPSLPRRWFDLAILPRHDGVAADAHTLLSEGALNRIQPALDAVPAQGLILVGGPSAHFDWDSATVCKQINTLVERTPGMHWTLTTSRRTPTDFAAQLPVSPALDIVPHTATPPDWLPAQFARCSTAWVTPDSASMVYEALTAGAEVGVFDLPVNPKSRIGRAVSELADAQRITRFVSWCAHGTLHPNTYPLAEADRCAAWILEWLENK